MNGEKDVLNLRGHILIDRMTEGEGLRRVRTPGLPHLGTEASCSNGRFSTGDKTSPIANLGLIGPIRPICPIVYFAPD